MRKKKTKIKKGYLARRHRRCLALRAKISGTAERPRVNVCRSNKNLFVQVIDDSAGKTLFSVQTFGKRAVAQGSNKESGKTTGVKVATILQERNIKTVVFDRNGRRYHGVIAAIADSLREGGIRL